MDRTKHAAYLVRLECTNSRRNSVNRLSSVHNYLGDYIKVQDGEAIIVTNTPTDIYEFFGKDNVMSVKRIGVGYYIPDKEEGEDE